MAYLSEEIILFGPHFPSPGQEAFLFSPLFFSLSMPGGVFLAFTSQIWAHGCSGLFFVGVCRCFFMARRGRSRQCVLSTVVLPFFFYAIWSLIPGFFFLFDRTPPGVFAFPLVFLDSQQIVLF